MSGLGHPPPVERDCAELSTAISTARETIGDGGSASIETLAERLTALLDRVAGLSARERAAHLERLLGLYEEIEALGVVIDAERRRCGERIAKGGASMRAALAYTSRSLG